MTRTASTFTLANARRVDPTRTTGIRNMWEREAARRWSVVAKAITAKLVDDDAFGYNRHGWETSGTLRNTARYNADFDFPTSQGRIGAFVRWLREQQERGVLDITEGEPMESASHRSWQNLYIRSSYQKGIARSAAQMRKGGLTVTDRWVDAAFFRPFHADRMGILYTRAYSDLEGVTKTMETRMARVLASGIQDGKHPRKIAKEMTDQIGSIAAPRARLIARTETIHAHAEATLNTFEEAGIEGVEIDSEFSTARDNKVCPKCEPLEGRTFTTAQARGIIPVHPNCRCGWIPVVTNAAVKELL